MGENTDSGSGSDVDSDDELDDDIRDEIEYLSSKPRTKDTQNRLITLKKLLRSELQKKGPLPLLPDH
jgi:hypothetical protein